MTTIIDANGIERHLGNNPAPIRYGWRVYGDVPAAPLILRSQWDSLVPENDGLEDHWSLPPIHDQNGYGMCNASATCAAMESANLMMGQAPISLSAGDLYNRICGGSDRGSLLEDGIVEAMRGGVCSTAVNPYLSWQRRASGAAEDGKNYLALEAFLCPTFEHCYSAVLSQFKLISGIMWYQNYDPDQDGWLPSRGTGSPGGHAVFGYGAKRRRGVYGIAHNNSWKPSWGVRGRCIFPESAYQGPVGGWWAVRQIVYRQSDVPPLK